MSTFRAPEIGRREVGSPLRPASTARRVARRAGWALAATMAVASPKIAQWIGGLISPPAAVEVQRSRPAGRMIRPQTPSPEFLEHWQRELPQALRTYLGIKTDADMAENLSSFVYKLPSGEMYIWRLQNSDTVSEGTGYGTTVIAIYSSAANSREFQPIFHGLIKGYLTAREYNPNGLMPWRLEKVTTHNEKGEIVIKMVPPSLTDKHSATDSELYTAWALIEADQLVKNNVWEAPAEGRDFYRTLAADILSKIKAHCVVEMNGRLILTVSDSWGHPDVLKGAVTINPSYFNPTALRIFAEFDRSQTRQGENYWLKVLKDNFDIFSESINFSKQMFEELNDPEKIKQLVIENTQGNYVLDWVRREYLRSLLGRAGFELTEFGIEPLEKNGERLTQKDRDNRMRKHLQDGDPSLVQMDKGQLVVTKEMFEKILSQISDAHVIPFVPDQLEVVVESDGRIKVRIEFGESQLSFVEKYDGIRGYRELAVYLGRYDDTSDPSVPVELKVSSDMQKLLLDLMEGKQAGNARVDQFRELTPLATLLLGAYGTGDETMSGDFEAAFNGYIGVHTLFDPADKAKKMPRYFGPTLALLSLTEVLEMGAQPSSDILPLERSIAPAPRVEKELERPLPPSTNLLDAPLDFLVDYMTNFGSSPTYPITAQKMARDAQANAQEFRPTRATAHYNAGSGLRNAAKYRAAADEFYQSLLLARWEENPREVLMAMFNIEQILKTLNYAPAEIADIFTYLSERDGLDPQVRLALMGGAIKQLNEAGNHNRALLLGIDFLKRYKEIKSDPSLIDQLRNYSENTDLPCRQLLVNVITQIMRAAARQGRIAHLETNIGSIPSLEFEIHISEQIADIIIGDKKYNISGNLGELLQLISELRSEIPDNFKSHILLAQSGVLLDEMYTLNAEIDHFSMVEVNHQELRKTEEGKRFFANMRINILENAAKARQSLLSVLRLELTGERDVSIIELALRNLGAIQSFIPKIYADLAIQQTTLYRISTESQGSISDEALAGRRPIEIQNRSKSFLSEYWQVSNLEYRKAIFINKVAQNAFQGLDLNEYIGELPVNFKGDAALVSLILTSLALLLRAGKIKKIPKIRKKLAASSGFAAVLALALGITGDAPQKEPAEVKSLFSGEEVDYFLRADDLWANPQAVLSTQAYEIFQRNKGENQNLPPVLLVEKTLESLGETLSPKAQELLGTHVPGWEMTLGSETLRRIIGGIGLTKDQKQLFSEMTEIDLQALKDMQQLTLMRQAGFLEAAGLIEESVVILAKAIPSADPRNENLVDLMLSSADLYLGWAEIPARQFGPEDLSARSFELYNQIRENDNTLSVEDSLRKIKEELERDQGSSNHQWDFALARKDLEIIDKILGSEQDPYASERMDRLETALHICQDSTEIFVSNLEHRTDLTIRAVSQMAFITHKYLEFIRQMVEVDLQTFLRGGGLPENMDSQLRQRFLDKSILLKARFLAMLEGREYFEEGLMPYLNKPQELDALRTDSIVRFFFTDETQILLREIFDKYPDLQADAYAHLGNTTWWGQKDTARFIEALGYYEDALEYDCFNIAALYGKAQILLMEDVQKASPELLQQHGVKIDRYEFFRTFQRALQATQQKGVDPNLVSGLIRLTGDIWQNDPLAKELSRIADSTDPNDIKVKKLLDRLSQEGF